MLSARIYIRVESSRLRIHSPQTSGFVDMKPAVAIRNENGKYSATAYGEEALKIAGKPSIKVVNPFGHPRSLVSDFTVAEFLMRHAISEIFVGRWLKPILTGIVHPIGNFEGGLTQVEYRAFNELCSVAGCRNHTVHEGKELGMQEVKEYQVVAS